MKRVNIINQMGEHANFTREDLKKAIIANDSNYNLENISSFLESYINKGFIIKEKANTYSVTTSKRYYTYNLNYESNKIVNFLNDEYPDIKFQVWEFTQLNEFLNHLLSTTTYVVEVENTFVESVFEILNEKYDSVLLKPSCEDFFRYGKTGTIVVKRLISESPCDIDTPHQPCLEKILVDIIVDKFTSNLINQSEIPDIYQYAYKKYMIDERKLFRYAKRRNAHSIVNNLINEAKDKIL